MKAGNPDALVAIGETSPRGHDLPSRGTVQDSHSPARFARLLAERSRRLEFDAWAQHPYPPRAGVAPTAPVRWPRVGLDNLERFGESLDAWFGREDTPLWVTEYGHETPPDPLGIAPGLQADYATSALDVVEANPRVRMFVWFIVRDMPATPWQSGVLAESGAPKPAFESSARPPASSTRGTPSFRPMPTVARVPGPRDRLPHAGGRPDRRHRRRQQRCGLGATGGGRLARGPARRHRANDSRLHATDAHGRSVDRRVKLGATSIQLD